MPVEQGQFRARTRPASLADLALAAAFVAACWLIHAYPWISGTVTIPWDAKTHFMPQLQFLAASLAEGQSPLWNPYVFSGWPQIADPRSLLFSPPHLALAALSPAPSFAAADAVTLGVLLFGAVGLMLFFRDRGWHMAGATVAALVFIVGGSASAQIEQTGHILSLSVWPWALLLLARALDRSSRRWGLVAGLFGGWLAIGRDQVALLAIAHLTAFTLWHVAAAPARAEAARAVVRPLLTGALGWTLVAGVPIMLTLPLLATSYHLAHDLTVATRHSLDPGFGLVALIPNLYGSLGPAADYWGPASDGWSATAETGRAAGHLYFGAIPALLIIAHGLVGGRMWARDIRFHTVALVVFLLYALGGHTPVYRLLYEMMPGVDLFRRPIDATFHVGFAVAIVAGYLTHRLVTDGPPQLKAPQRLLLAALAVAAIGGAIWVAGAHDKLDAAWRPLSIAIGVAAVSAVAIVVAGRLGAAAGLASMLVLALPLAADLIRHNGAGELNALPPSVYEVLRPDSRDPIIAELQSRMVAGRTQTRRDRVEMIGLGFAWPNAGMPHRLEHVLGYNTHRLRNYQQATGADENAAIWQMRKFAPAMPGYQSPLANILGLRHIASPVPLETIDKSFDPKRWPEPLRLPNGFIYENPDTLPRVQLVGSAIEADMASLWREGRWPRIDFRLGVIINTIPDGVPEFEPLKTVDNPGVARILDYRNDRVSIETVSSRPAMLVLNDVWHPWWQANVNGKLVPIQLANGLVRAIAVPAGTSRIEFAFRPIEGAWAQLTGRIGDRQKFGLVND